MCNYNDGYICLFFDQGLDSCSCNGSQCDCPFSKKGCEIQCERIFKEKPEGMKADRYIPNRSIDSNKTLTKADVFKRVGMKRGMIVADWFIPYYQLDEMRVHSSDQIKYGIEMVKKKFEETKYYMEHMRIYHNVEIVGQVGIYILGVNVNHQL